MFRQFLLNPDGSIPNNTNVELLKHKKIPLVLPAQQWQPAIGMMLVESEPEQDDNGVWRQKWVETEIIENNDL